MKRINLVEEDLNNEHAPTSAAPSLDRWASVLNAFIDDKIVYSKPRTVDYYESHARLVAEWAIGQKVTLEGFTPAIMGRYLTERKQSGVTDSTRRKDCQVIKNLMYWAFQNGHIQQNRFSDYRIIKAKDKVMVAPADDDVEKLLKGIEPFYDTSRTDLEMSMSYRRFYMRRMRAILYLAADSGARIDELLEVRLRDLPPITCPRFQKQLGSEQHAGSPRPMILLRFTKTGKERLVPVSETSIWAIKEWLKSRPQREMGEQNQTRPATGNSHLFVNIYGDKADQHALRKLLYKIEDRAGCSRHFGFHDLRRYGATKMADHGITEAMEFLGHTNVKTTSRYLSTTKNRISEAHAAVSPLESRILRSHAADKSKAIRDRRKPLI